MFMSSAASRRTMFAASSGEKQLSSDMSGVSRARRSADMPCRSRAGRGCSSASIPQEASARITRRAVGAVQPWFASSFSRTPGPTASRMSHTASISASGSSPVFILMCRKPRAASPAASAAMSSGAARAMVLSVSTTGLLPPRKR